MLKSFISDLQNEMVLMLKKFKNQLQQSINDFKTETANLRNDLASGIEKFKEKLNL